MCVRYKLINVYKPPVGRTAWKRASFQCSHTFSVVTVRSLRGSQAAPVGSPQSKQRACSVQRAALQHHRRHTNPSVACGHRGWASAQRLGASRPVVGRLRRWVPRARRASLTPACRGPWQRGLRSTSSAPHRAPRPPPHRLLERGHVARRLWQRRAVHKPPRGSACSGAVPPQSSSACSVVWSPNPARGGVARGRAPCGGAAPWIGGRHVVRYLCCAAPGARKACGHGCTWRDSAADDGNVAAEHT